MHRPYSRPASNFRLLPNRQDNIHIFSLHRQGCRFVCRGVRLGKPRAQLFLSPSNARLCFGFDLRGNDTGKFAKEEDDGERAVEGCHGAGQLNDGSDLSARHCTRADMHSHTTSLRATTAHGCGLPWRGTRGREDSKHLQQHEWAKAN